MRLLQISFKHHIRKTLGFTLIELLIVIVIVATLAISIFVALQPAKRFQDTRDATRTIAVDSLTKAINTYTVDKHTLPTGLTTNMTETQLGTCGLGEAPAITTGGCNIPAGKACVDLTSPLAAYLKSIPVDPKFGTTAQTYYSISVDANSIVDINACGIEGTTMYADDSFTRTISGGWASADTGGAYALSGTAANFTVNGNEGIMNIPTANTQYLAILNNVALQNADTKVKLKFDKTAVGGPVLGYFLLRNSSAGNYRAQFRFETNGTITTNAQHFLQSTGVTTDITATTTISGLTATASTYYWMRSQIVGINPTTINIKIWQDGTSEPSTWQYSATDSTSALQTPGSIGLMGRISATATNAPIVFTFDSLSITSNN